jgi:hypothetical protein
VSSIFPAMMKLWRIMCQHLGCTDSYGQGNGAELPCRRAAELREHRSYAATFKLSESTQREGCRSKSSRTSTICSGGLRLPKRT